MTLNNGTQKPPAGVGVRNESLAPRCPHGGGDPALLWRAAPIGVRLSTVYLQGNLCIRRPISWLGFTLQFL
jgi:hypothetical protein